MYGYYVASYITIIMCLYIHYIWIVVRLFGEHGDWLHGVMWLIVVYCCFLNAVVMAGLLCGC